MTRMKPAQMNAGSKTGLVENNPVSDPVFIRGL
jgi:hypothetical protein